MLAYSLVLGFTYSSGIPANFVARGLVQLQPWPLPLAYYCGLGLVVAYGLTAIATAGRPGVKLTWSWVPFRANRPAGIWWGLAFVLSPAVGFLAGLLSPPYPAALSILAPVGIDGGVAVAAGCILASATAANSEVKRAILAGRAPSFRISSDQLWWWDGGDWASVLLAAPPGALRSAGGNYWWTGSGWLSLPPRPRRR
ncbi:MAG: hypothetical protein WCB85_06180 [Candidatus Dormiibacterota bacterium]